MTTSTQAGADEDGADRQRAEPLLVQAQRSEHGQQPEQKRWQRVEPEAGEEGAVADRARHGAGRLLLHWGVGAERHPARQRHGDDTRGGERGLDAHQVGDRAEQRAEDRAQHGEAERRADQLPTAVAGRRRRQPGERARPRRRCSRSPAGSAPRPSTTASRTARRRSWRPRAAPARRAPRLRAPNRAARRPPGMPPARAPAPNAPTSSPAPVFERSNRSASSGTSGTSAPNSIASTKTIALTRTTRRRMR